MAGRSRMNREVRVQICGGLEVRFLRSTRLCIDYSKLRQADTGLHLRYNS